MFVKQYSACVLQAAPDNIIVGSHVWVEDPVLAWIDGEVTRINGQEVRIITTNRKTVSGPFVPFLFALNMS